MWWFEGDRQAARRKFIERGTVWVQCMDIQLQALQNESKALASFIGGHVLSVLDKDGASLPPETIYAQICQTA